MEVFSFLFRLILPEKTILYCSKGLERITRYDILFPLIVFQAKANPALPGPAPKSKFVDATIQIIVSDVTPIK